MRMSRKEYSDFVKQREPKSPLGADLVRAFVIGGLICCVGQALSMAYERYAGLDKESAGTAASITLIGLSAVLTGLNIYDQIARFAGAGTLVPITGFANSVVSPALEFKSEGAVLGIGAKMFTIAGPVIVYGTAASVVYGLVLWLVQAIR